MTKEGEFLKSKGFDIESIIEFDEYKKEYKQSYVSGLLKEYADQQSKAKDEEIKELKEEVERLTKITEKDIGIIWNKNTEINQLREGLQLLIDNGYQIPSNKDFEKAKQLLNKQP